MAGRLLLFRTRDPVMPETGEWWELPGGGMDPGESVSETAARELAEETGIVVAVDEIPAPTWTRTATYVHGHVRVLQHEHVVVVRLDDDRPVVVVDGQTPEERAAYGEARWWRPAEVESSSERFYPGTLPLHLASFLDGATIDEPFESWN